MKRTEKDICIVIPSYRRSEEVDKTLASLIKYKNIPGKIYVVDQSEDNSTKKVVQKYKKKLPVEFVFSKQPSSSIAKNKGVNLAKKKYPLILILDDDVDLLKDYFKNALKEFNSHPDLMGLGGLNEATLKQKPMSFFLYIYSKIFFLPLEEKNKFRIRSSYGNTGSMRLSKPVRDVEWLPGFNMLFRREVFENYAMPESKGYNVLEDLDSSYYTFRKFGKGSLVITPACRANHRFSQTARYPTKKRVFVNHEDHLYFQYTYFPGLTNKIIFQWSKIGIVLGLLVRAIFIPTKNNCLALKYNLQALKQARKNKEKIRKGILRTFLNPDLSMTKEYI
ncbi:MAG: glycosyltransferase [archaeon]